MVKQCEYCGKEISVKPCRAHRHNFCSHECYSKSMKIYVKVMCDACGKVLKRKPSGVQAENFCNLKCRSAFRQGKNHPRYVEYPVKYCVICGGELPHYLAGKEESKYCSRKCQNIGITGENNYWWKGGVSFESYPSAFSLDLKELIRKRDNYVCQACGRTQEDEQKEFGKRLSVHHIDSDKNNNVPENLITTCQRCNSVARENQEHWMGIYTNIVEKKSINTGGSSGDK